MSNCVTQYWSTFMYLRRYRWGCVGIVDSDDQHDSQSKALIKLEWNMVRQDLFFFRLRFPAGVFLAARFSHPDLFLMKP